MPLCRRSNYKRNGYNNQPQKHSTIHSLVSPFRARHVVRSQSGRTLTGQPIERLVQRLPFKGPRYQMRESAGKLLIRTEEFFAPNERLEHRSAGEELLWTSLAPLKLIWRHGYQDLCVRRSVSPQVRQSLRQAFVSIVACRLFIS
jgi:hypothetical protein